MMTRPCSLHRLGFAALLACVLHLPSLAFAGSQEINEEIVRSTNEELDAMHAGVDKSVKAMNGAITGSGGLIPAMIQIETDRKTDEITPSPIDQLAFATSAVPQSIALTDLMTKFVMSIRMQELQRVSYDPNTKPDFLVDTGLSVKERYVEQQYDIYFRYFCDPNSRAGTMANVNSGNNARTITLPYGTGSAKALKTYSLRCGYVTGQDAASVPTRRSVLGANLADTGGEALQVISLPTRPEALFFNPVSFPVKLGTTAPGASSFPPNVNRIAPSAYLSAFAMSMQFLLGEPPAPGDTDAQGEVNAADAGVYIAAQKEVATKMLASYPFAVLFAERTGTLGKDAAGALATMLETKLGAGTGDINIVNQIASLRNRNSLSMAEYMNIVAYQLPTSPGYFERVQDLTPDQLERESVFWEAMQTALKYQQNRWLEMGAAIEAVGR